MKLLLSVEANSGQYTNTVWSIVIEAEFRI
jgi:hypothetical protein